MATAATFSILGFLLLGVMVIAPLIVGIVLIVKSRSRGPNFPSCGGCGYDVTGLIGASTRCPECGKEFVVVGIRPPGDRRSPVMLWMGILIMVIPLTCVSFVGVMSMMSAQRMATARQAALAAQAQAIAAQQAQANALFPVPAPLTDQQIYALSTEQASAAMANVSAALNRTDLSDDDRARLQKEFASLARQSAQTRAERAIDERIPAPLTDEQIKGMTLAQAQSAITKVAVGRRNAQLSKDKDRLKTEFEKLLNHISELKGRGPISPPGPGDEIPADLLPPKAELPLPLTDEQIDGMTLPEATAALTKVAIARKQVSTPEKEKPRLRAEFDRLLKRIIALRSGS